MVEIEIPLVPEASEQYLNEKQRADYETYRRRFLEWLKVFGKDPESVEGYAQDTVKRTAYRVGKWERFIWEEEEAYTISLTHTHADNYMRSLAMGDYSSAHRSNTQDALKRYFKWRKHEHGESDWEPELTFNKKNDRNPPDYLTKTERKQVREVALNYGSIPNYDSLSPPERSRWKRYVSQVVRKPVEDIKPDDWKQVNGWKYTSMVWTSLDAGLRPVEIGRATTDWVDLENELLRIPMEDSSKNRNDWHAGLTTRTTDALEQWLSERKNYSRYHDTDALWLTREGNPYGSNSLRRILHRLCEKAGIDVENRSMSWYSIRHSVGTGMAKERGLAAAQAQLRHESVQTTMKYDQVPIDERRDALDKMG